MLFFLVLLPLINALNCPQGQYQCSSVTLDYNYVECSSGTCKCRTSLGFVGNATLAGKCSCPSPLEVYWKSGVPYCTSLQNGVQFQLNTTRDKILREKTTSLFNYILWPNSQALAYQILADNLVGGYFDLFAENAKGRVDPLGSFNDKKGIVEYYVGTIWTGVSRVLSYHIRALVASGNKVGVTADMLFAQYATPTDTVPYYYYNFTQTGIITFDDNNLIKSMDMINRNVGLNVGHLFDESDEHRQIVCYIIMVQANCNSTYDPAGYYSSFEDCYNYQKAIPFGNWDNQRTNSTLCRLYHATLAGIDPYHHCPHAGKTGGGKCFDYPREAYWDVDY